MGKIFVIDGTDGSGKQTQFELLCKKFDEQNIPYVKISFPRYDSPSSALVKMYLGGEFGDDAQAISPYVASIFFSVDRYAGYKQEMEQAIKEGKVVLLDRYTTANMVHQAGKIQDKKERDKFLKWLWDLEFHIMGLPVPDKVFFLNMPPEFVEILIKNRKNKITGDGKKDIHERSEEHLRAAYEAGCYVAKKYKWYQIMCYKHDSLRTIEDIHHEIYTEVEKYL